MGRGSPQQPSTRSQASQQRLHKGELCKGVDSIAATKKELHPGTRGWEVLGRRDKRRELLPELSQGGGVA